MPLLTIDQFLATFSEIRHRVVEQEPPFDIWPYFDTIPTKDFQGHDCSAGVVENAWRMEPGPYEHVLVNSEALNIFMVLIIDHEAGVVYGHRLLDLNREYDLDA